jgi:hypothetical protein
MERAFSQRRHTTLTSFFFQDQYSTGWKSSLHLLGPRLVEIRVAATQATLGISPINLDRQESFKATILLKQLRYFFTGPVRFL